MGLGQARWQYLRPVPPMTVARGGEVAASGNSADELRAACHACVGLRVCHDHAGAGVGMAQQKPPPQVGC